MHSSSSAGFDFCTNRHAESDDPRDQLAQIHVNAVIGTSVILV